MAMFDGKILALSGGVGGAKLLHGLAELLPAEQLVAAVNTADDFEFWDLRICPDLDSNMYALAALNDQDRGWGMEDESWRTMVAMRRLGGETWFQMGDQDLATHLYRSMGLRGGKTLTEVTAAMCHHLGVSHRLLPMCEEPVATEVTTDQGVMEFQEYFVRERCQPVVKSLRFKGIAQARLNPAIEQWLQDDALAAVVICPSNPFLSVDPMLSVPGFRAALQRSGVPIVAVAPIVAGNAVKGPLGKMMAELDIPASADQVVRYYQQHHDQLLSGYVLDEQDSHLADDIVHMGVAVTQTDTMMTDMAAKQRVASTVLELIEQLRRA